MSKTKKKPAAATKAVGKAKPAKAAKLKTTATTRGVGTTKAKSAAAKNAAKKVATAPRRHTGAEPPKPSAASSKRIKEARAAAEAAIDAALDKKALVPVLLDVSEQATYTDFIGVVSGRSDRQVDAIAEGVAFAMKKRGWHLLGREGAGNGRWTLLDFGDFVLHIFYHPVREFYDIEGLWIEAPRLKLNVPPESLHVQEDALYETV